MSNTEKPRVIGYALKAGASLPRDWQGPTAYTVEEFNDLVRTRPGVADTVKDNYTTPLYDRMGWISLTINTPPWASHERETMSNETTELKPCFCGRIPKIETRDVEPQEDRFFSGKTITFVLCECGQCLFDGAFHEGFADEEDAATAWNYRVATEVVEAANAVVERWDSPLWKDAEPTAAFIARLRAALAKYRGEG